MQIHDFPIERYKTRFKEYYKKLENKENIFYIFFTSDLLYVFLKCLSFIPETVNIVCIASNLREEEKKWLASNVKQDVFLIDELCDDRDIWEILFATNQNSFGWLDVDCFVYSPEIFKEIIFIPDDVSMNVVWTYKDPRSGHQFLNTFFVFINMDVLNKVREKYPQISPRTYIYSGDRMPFFTRSNIFDDDLLKIIRDIFPDGKYTGNLAFLDTLFMYQLTCEACGYRIRAIRDLSWDNYYSDELMHISGCVLFSDFPNRMHYSSGFDITISQILTLVLQIYSVFNQYIAVLPPYYQNIRVSILSLLEKYGFKEEMVKGIVQIYLRRYKLSKETIYKFMHITA